VVIADVNVLVAAFRSDHPHHGVVRPWLDRLLASSQSLAVPDLVWVGFVRIVTSKRVFLVPASVADAFDFVEAIRAQPGHLALPQLPRLMDVFADLCRAQSLVGNLVTDAFIAATALCLGAPVVTLDRDFRRFDLLKIVEPGAEGVS
jgi:toxin-antitoxin system PIN domain toxin